MDVLGTAPTSIQMRIMLLMPKPQGGRRPLGHYPAMPRLHANYTGAHVDPGNENLGWVLLSLCLRDGGLRTLFGVVL
eukprot:1864693-Pyramimonas_sp.AAC.1